MSQSLNEQMSKVSNWFMVQMPMIQAISIKVSTNTWYKNCVSVGGSNGFNST